MASCWGTAPNVDTMLTTFNARTFLQPQLNKAVKMSEKHLKGDVNPKVRSTLRSYPSALGPRRRGSGKPPARGATTGASHQLSVQADGAIVSPPLTPLHPHG
jgi:hypothetical protein